MKPEKKSMKKAAKSLISAVTGGDETKPARTRKPRKAATPQPDTIIAAAETPAATPTSAPAPRKRAAARKAPLEIPPILLEGDKPPVAMPSGPGQRYSLGPVPPSQVLPPETAAELPEAYGTRQLLLTARDPHWLYAHWDLTREQQQKYNSLSTDRHLVVRVFVNEAKGEPFSQVHVHPESTHWFIHVANAGTKYVGELGYYQPGGKWVSISTSSATLTPPDSVSEDITAQFATIPIEVPFAQLLELARAVVRENIPLAEVLQQLRAHGHDVPEPSEGKWTPEQERALSAIISMDRVRRVWMGSLEITELIRRRMQQELSSIGLAPWSWITSPAGAISSFSSVSSPFGAQAREKGFWFMVNAELIIYGATEPDAQVTVAGREIKLRQDGTFSFRFALPDGAYELPAVAISSDKTDGRAAELKFSRSTEYRGEVGVHPQDPNLKAPLAANVG